MVFLKSFFSLWFFHFSKFWFSAGDKSVSLDDVIQLQWSDRITDHRIRRWLLVGWLTKTWSGFFQKTGENERFDSCSRIWDKAFGWSNENYPLALFWLKLPQKSHWIQNQTIKRLAKGIEADISGKYEKLKGLPKGLLPIGKGFKVHLEKKMNRHSDPYRRPNDWSISAKASGELYIRDKPLIGHWVVDLLKSDFVQTICIISNAHFYNQFEQWYNQLEEKSRIVLLNDGSTSNETRLGAGKANPVIPFCCIFICTRDNEKTSGKIWTILYCTWNENRIMFIFLPIRPSDSIKIMFI